jgi:hypothetical protein
MRYREINPGQIIIAAILSSEISSNVKFKKDSFYKLLTAPVTSRVTKDRPAKLNNLSHAASSKKKKCKICTNGNLPDS